MKRLASVLAALLLAAPAAALTATTTNNANLRSAPATSAQVLTIIPAGKTLNVGTCSTWCQASYGGKAGYVSKSLLRLPISAPPALPASNGTYTNVDGQQIQRPVAADSAPPGASAHCRDGTYSFSTHRRGTCSHHGGVDNWL
ncbi:DUF3761 domain-containing protein [Deinococcus ruber]|uniref:SH3b domain-containing protein n=1 Tax=Deinococcus ruber TaxID=1848197 RepID=A0A918F755_9DEIO|nr:DUF3761 domain-containing protein [Deinococcus ruber]GGR11678.1 hypothetical protein GCM10008957_25870 [Deinococcus ruber]